MLYLVHKYLSQAAAGTARLRAGTVGKSNATGGAGAGAGDCDSDGDGDCGGNVDDADVGAVPSAPTSGSAAAPTVAGGAVGAVEDNDVSEVRASLRRLRCALPLPTGDFATAHEDWSAGQPPLHPHAAAAFQTALLSNANLCGDNCNRGMLAGALLGFMFGAHNIPAPLVSGLHRYAGELRDTVKSFVATIIRPQIAVMASAHPHHDHDHASATAPSRFGRPALLPVLRFPLYETGGAGTAASAETAAAAAAAIGVGAGRGASVLVHEPRDLAHKLHMIHACAEVTQTAAAAATTAAVATTDASSKSSSSSSSSGLVALSNAGQPLLRFHKGAGPLLLEPAAPAAASIQRVPLTAAAASAGRVARPLLLPAPVLQERAHSSASQVAATPVTDGTAGSSAAGADSAVSPASDLDDGDAAADRAAALAAMEAGNASGIVDHGSGTSGVMPPPPPTPVAEQLAAAAPPTAVAVSRAVAAAPLVAPLVVRVADMHESATDSEAASNALLDASTLALPHLASAAVAAVTEAIGVTAAPGTGILYYRPRDAAAAAALLRGSGTEHEPWAAIVARHRDASAAGAAAGAAGAGAGAGLTEAASGTCQ